VNYPKATVVDTNSLPCLRSAVVKYEDLRVDGVQNTRNKEANYRKAMTVLTFGALAGGGAAALYSAHTDAVLALGLAGGGAYGAGNLFWLAERGRVLNRGNDALQCLIRTGAEVVASDVSFAMSDENITGFITALRFCTGTTEANAVAAGERAVSNLAAFRALDGTFASLLEGSANTVITAMNESLEKLEPTPASGQQAAQAVSQFATGFVTDTTTAASKAKPLIQFNGCPANSAELAQELDRQAKNLDAALAEKTNKMSAISSLCVFKDVSLGTLAVSPQQVNVAKDITVHIDVTGVFGLLRARWLVKTPASDKLQFSIDSANRISIKGNSALTAKDGPFELEISDQRPVPTPVRIWIQTTGSSIDE